MLYSTKIIQTENKNLKYNDIVMFFKPFCYQIKSVLITEKLQPKCVPLHLAAMYSSPFMIAYSLFNKNIFEIIPWFLYAKCLQLCLTLCNPMWPSRLLCPWNSLGKDTGVGCHTSSKGSSWPKIEPVTLASSTLASGFLTTSAPWEVHGPYGLIIHKFSVII